MTKFKVAEHKTIRAGERDFLFLAAEKTIFEMDPPTRDLLGRWSEAGEATREEVTTWLTDLSEAERDELLEGLLAAPGDRAGKRRGTAPRTARARVRSEDPPEDPDPPRDRGL